MNADTAKQVKIGKDQTLKEFESNELSKIGMTLSEYQKTDAFTSGLFLSSEMKEKGFTATDAAKQSFNSFLESGEAEEDKGREKKDTAVSKEQAAPTEPLAPIPPPKASDLDTTAGQADPEPTYGAKKKIVIDDISAPENPAATPRFSLARKLPKVITSFRSNLKYMQTTYKKDVIFYSRDDLTISVKDRAAFELSFFETVSALADRIDGYLGVFPSVIEDYYQESKITPYDKIGFNAKAFIDSLDHPNRYRTAKAFPKTLENTVRGLNRMDVRYRKKIVYLGQAHEHDFIVASDTAARARFAPARQIHDLFAHFRDMNITIAPLQNYDPRKHFFLRPYRLDALGAWLDMPENARLRSTMWDVAYDMVTTTLPTNIVPNDTTLASLLSVMGARRSSYSQVHNYPHKLNSSMAIEAFKAVITSKMASRWGQIWVDIPIDDLDIGILFACITMKLYHRQEEIHPRTVVDIHNYLARWLIPSLPGYRIARDPFNLNVARDRGNDYLLAQYTSGCVQGMPAFWEFILSWVDAGQSADVPLPNVAVNLMNPRTCLYKPFTGKTNTRKETPLIFVRFTNWLLEIRNARARNPFNLDSPDKYVDESFYAMLRWMRERRDPYTEMSYFIDRYLRSHSLNALVYPDHSAFRDELDPVIVPLDGYMSLFAYGNFSGSTPLIPPVDLVSTAWALHENFDELVMHYHLAERFLTRDVWSRKDYMEHAFAKTPTSPLLQQLKMKLFDEGEMSSMVMLPDTYIDHDIRHRFDLAEAYIRAHIHEFGMIEDFIYAPDSVYAQLGNNIQRILVPSGVEGNALTYEDVQDLISSEGFAAVIRSARENKQYIKFKFPAAYEFNHVEQWKDQPSILTLPTKSTVLQVGAIRIDFTFDDVVIDDTIASMADERNAAYLSTRHPFIHKQEEILPELYFHIEVDREEPVLTHTVEFLARAV
jgi:hypothetical protein